MPRSQSPVAMSIGEDPNVSTSPSIVRDGMRRKTSVVKQKTRQLDFIFRVHAIWAAITGTIALLVPQVFEIFMNFGGVEEGCNKLTEHTNTIIRLYGALILAQSWLVWQTRKVPDPFVRKIFVQGYLLCFGLSSLVLLHKQIFSTEWAHINWSMIGLFSLFTCVYAWFLATKKLFDFDLDDAALV